MAAHGELRVPEVIERIVRQARLPGESARDDLCRELETHFDEAETCGVSTCEAMARFGPALEVARSFSRVYRWDFLSLYAARAFIAVVAAGAAAEFVLAAVHLRVASSGVHLAPGFFYTYMVGIKIVLAMAAAWEIGRKPFNAKRAAVAFALYCVFATWLQASFSYGLSGWEPWHMPMLTAIGAVASRTGRSSLRPPLMFVGFTGYLFATVTTNVTPRPLVGAALVIIWLVTEQLFSRFDRAFADWFTIPMETSLTSTISGRASS
ncbi:MAG: hypothetical protein ND807_05425 [Vicinamibacterales bacterium]|nr:hypothetical protein [Vicinamibacterales bacterium]